MEFFTLSIISSLVYNKINQAISKANEDEKHIKISRVESEYTLGFEKSQSVVNILNELGPLCSGGKQVILYIKFITCATVVTYSFYHVRAYLQPPKWQYYAW